MPNVELNPQQEAFLIAYLEADIPDEGPSLDELRDAVDLSNLNPADLWIEAMAEVDASLSSLKARLLGSGDPNLDRIAQMGLIGITGGNHRALMGAFMSYSRTDSEAKAEAGKELLKVVAACEAFVMNDEIITLLENFPGETPAVIRAPLTRALTQIRHVVAS